MSSPLNDACHLTKYYATAEAVNLLTAGVTEEAPWAFSIGGAGTVVGTDTHGNAVTFLAAELNTGQLYPMKLAALSATSTATHIRFWWR